MTLIFNIRPVHIGGWCASLSQKTCLHWYLLYVKAGNLQLFVPLPYLVVVENPPLLPFCSWGKKKVSFSCLLTVENPEKHKRQFFKKLSIWQNLKMILLNNLTHFLHTMHLSEPPWCSLSMGSWILISGSIHRQAHPRNYQQKVQETITQGLPWWGSG